ncbi:hypothetical protein RvY_12905 [Ramazzottius varieornatus]|uniref:ENPP1-3/EXOG-like endonuclease/phosphodiesterase domain-containing protein n=1 Tax=Ramazzottius varieornatus TaxID=947166 RepID=A0A1D1VN21_RAMVA|nr:hypothetical protein RvY_12905 [Ramazzottius varieornatus]
MSANGKSKNHIFWWTLGAFFVGAALFAIGYVSGYFTPRPGPSAPSRLGSWREGPCTTISNDQCPKGYRDSPPLVVISFDGFRAEYLARRSLNIPSVRRMQQCGVHAPSMRPTFPPITFPNHYSIATGLHAESHGIVANAFFDQRNRTTFNYHQSSARESRWWLGEPIWVTAKKQGKRAHTYFWVGSEAEIMGIRPDEYHNFDGSHSFERRVDTVLDWLSRPDSTRPQLNMMYLEQPDSAGHTFGTDSPRLEAAVVQVDAALDRLMQGLHERGILQCINVLLVSDHGMQNHYCNQTVELSPIFEQSPALAAANFNDSNYILYGGVMGRISLDRTNATIDDFYEALKCAAPNDTGAYSKYQLYKKENLPRRFHYTNEDRTEPILMTLKQGHTVWKRGLPTSFCEGGQHGYDSLYPSQQAIFLGHGPLLKTQTTISPFSNIEVYNLMCDLIDVKPASNNGTYGSLHHALRNSKTVLIDSSGHLPPTQPRFPGTLQDLHDRQNPKCSATCGIADIDAADLRLNITESDAASIQRRVAPYGLPHGPGNGSTTVALVGQDFVLGFNHAMNATLWASFTLNNTMSDVQLPDTTCLRNDVRVSRGGLTCEDFPTANAQSNFSAIYLFPPGLSSDRENALIVSNALPMYRAFKNGIWTRFWDLLKIWAASATSLNVVTGPVYDEAAPYGILDPPADISEFPGHPTLKIPSHFFAVTAKTNVSCSSQPSCLPDVMAFILPHDPEERMPCQDEMSYFLTQSATVKDVEMSTGLRFFSGLPIYDGIKLRTSLPTKLWHLAVGLE